MSRRVLILGMGGVFGSAAARAFRAAGWGVDRYQRGSDITVAARGVRWIINAMDPPDSATVGEDLTNLTTRVLSAARDSGASVILPSDLEVFGKAPGPWGPDTPAAPITPHGHLRAGIEERYRDFAADGHSVVILRSGEFCGADASETLLNRVVLKSLRNKNRVVAIGQPETPRAYADLEDLTQIALTLAARADAAPGLHEMVYPGTVFSYRDLTQEIGHQLGREIAMRRLSWLVSSTGRSLRRARYMFETPQEIDPAPFNSDMPGITPKPLRQIVHEHLFLRGMTIQPDQGVVTSTQTSL